MLARQRAGPPLAHSIRNEPTEALPPPMGLLQTALLRQFPLSFELLRYRPFKCGDILFSFFLRQLYEVLVNDFCKGLSSPLKA